MKLVESATSGWHIEKREERNVSDFAIASRTWCQRIIAPRNVMETETAWGYICERCVSRRAKAERAHPIRQQRGVELEQTGARVPADLLQWLRQYALDHNVSVSRAMAVAIRTLQQAEEDEEDAVE